MSSYLEKVTAYAASKHSVMGLTQVLHVEGRECGVWTMALVVGRMWTNSSAPSTRCPAR